MNKKGFTLVEIIAVIVVLSLVIIIAATNGFGLFDKAKDRIKTQNLKTIEEGAKLFLLDIENCDDELDEELFDATDTTSCETLRIKYESLNYITFSTLKDAGYITGDNFKDEKIYNDESIKISFSKDNKKYNVIVEYTEIENDDDLQQDDSEEERLLADVIIENAKNTTIEQEKTLGQAIYREIPLTKPAEEVSNADEASLSVTEDDLGTSYYFRGNVKNNYISFAEMCWRIVRIEGDGSIRLILEDSSEMCSSDMDSDWKIGDTGVIYGSGANSIPDYDNYINGLKVELSTWFNNNFNQEININLSKDYKDYLKLVSQCLNDKKYDSSGVLITDLDSYIEEFSSYYVFIFDSLHRLSHFNPTLKCSSLAEPSYVYPLSADEIVFSGGNLSEINNDYYLVGYNDWWTISPAYFGSGGDDELAFGVREDGALSDGFNSGCPSYSRPSITLNKTSVWSKGNGTPGNAYEIVLKSK